MIVEMEVRTNLCRSRMLGMIEIPNFSFHELEEHRSEGKSIAVATCNHAVAKLE
jgi:hypothetical protein